MKRHKNMQGIVIRHAKPRPPSSSWWADARTRDEFTAAAERAAQRMIGRHVDETGERDETGEPDSLDADERDRT
jgi:hypothetical protein